MSNITLSVSEDLKKKMKKHPYVKWSTAVRSIIEQKIADFDEAESIARKSKLNWKILKPISTKISRNAAKHAKALMNETNG